MPYGSNQELPPSVRDRYSDKCQRAYRHAFNSVHASSGDEGKAAAAGHAAAKRCEGKMNVLPGVAPMRRFNIYTGLLTASGGGDQPMTIHGVASSNIRDYNGNHFLESALRSMERQAVGMTVFLNHKYQVPEDIFGVVTNARAVPKGDDLVDLHYDVEVDETRPRAVDTWNSLQRKPGRTPVKLGLSIGADIPDGGWQMDKQTGLVSFSDAILHETSVVGLPANPRSLIMNALKVIEEVAEAPVEPEELAAAPPADTSPCEAEGPAEDSFCSFTVGHDGRHSWDPPEAIVAETSPDQPDVNLDPAPEADDSIPGQDEPLAQEPAVQSGVALPDPKAVASVVASLESVDGKVDQTILLSAVELLRGMAETAVALGVERDAALQAKAAAERERDESIERANTVLAGVAEVVELIKTTPLGRKAVIRDAERSLSHLEGIYGAELISMMERTPDGRG